MKKFLIFILAVIPIVVVLALSATGTLIALSTPVNPERVEVRDENNEEISGQYCVELEGEERFLVINVLPAIAYSHEIEYEFDEEYGEGKVELEQTTGNRYRIKPTRPGVTRMIIRAKANYNAYTALSVVVSTDVIQEVKIYDEDGQRSDGESVALESAQRFYCDVSPVDALNETDVEWASNAPEIFTVNRNGLVTPIGRGRGILSVSARDRRGTKHSVSVEIDTTRALVKKEIAYSLQEPSAEWVREHLVLDDEAEVVVNSDGSFGVIAGTRSKTVRVIRTEENEIGFLDDLALVYKNNAPVFVEYGYLAEEKRRETPPQATLISSDPRVLTLSGNAVIPVGTGCAEVILSYSEGEVRREYTIKERPLTFDLNLTSADGKLGIGMTRVWGTEWYDGATDSFTNEYQFGSPDWNGENFDLLWSSSDPENFAVDQTGKIVFSAEARGKEGTISATVSVYGRATEMTRSFTFRAVDERDSVNVSNFEDFEQLTVRHPEKLPVLQADVKPKELIGEHPVTLCRGLYGNGFTVDYSQWQQAKDFYTILNVVNTLEVERISLVDIKIKGAEDYESSAGRGRAIAMRYLQCEVLLKHLSIFYTDTALFLIGGRDLTIEGCIFGDNNFTQINFNTVESVTENSQNRLVMRNNVMLRSHGPSIMAVSNDWDEQSYGKNIMPEFVVEGFLDCYNWMPPENIRGLLTGISPDIFTSIGEDVDPSGLFDALNSALSSLINGKAFEHLLYVDKKGKKWLNMGMIAVGTLMVVDKEKIVLEDDRLAFLRVPINSDEVEGTAGIFIAGIEIAMRIKGYTASNDCYLLTYDFAGKEPDVKPEDSVPTDRVLYARLQGKTSETEER